MHTQFAGSVTDFYTKAQEEGFAFLRAFYTLPSREAVFAIGIFGLIQAAFQLFLPGKRVNGPITPKGNTPIYTVERRDMSTVLRHGNMWLFLGKWCPVIAGDSAAVCHWLVEQCFLACSDLRYVWRDSERAEHLQLGTVCIVAHQGASISFLF